MKKLKADGIRTNMQLAVFIGLLFCIISLALCIFFTSNGLGFSNEDIPLWDIHLILAFLFAGVACLMYYVICRIIIHYSKIETKEE